ncbi:MAG: ATP-dependent sacrificial sulfur transferase LarE [Endomicrobiia bacterium]
MNKKLQKLYKIINKFNSIVIAYSGGVDSSFLLYICKKLNKKILAVTASSEIFPTSEVEIAEKFTKKLKIPHIIIKTKQLANKKFTKNLFNRCFHCKYEIYRKIQKLKKKLKYDVIFDGTNYDDIKNDIRPGFLAIRKLKVVCPLVEAKFTKKEIRKLSEKFKIPIWRKFSFSCLASRIPSGEKITKEKLRKVEKAEKIIKNYIKYVFRVRDHEELARIEVEKDKIKNFIINKNLPSIVKKLKKIGYKYICIDIEGYIPSGKRI